MTTNPGWYPGPTGQPGQRYYDSRLWTEHFTPAPPPAPTAVAAAVSHGGGTSHGLHLVLTLPSCSCRPDIQRRRASRSMSGKARRCT